MLITFIKYFWFVRSKLTTFVKTYVSRMKTTGEIIREQREKKGLLLRQLAAQLDIDAAILSKIERGDRKATRDQIPKLAKILEIPEEELLIQYISENIAYEIVEEDFASQALKVAEKKVKYLKSIKNGKI